MITAKQLVKFAKQQRRNLTPSEAAFRSKLNAAGIAYKNHPVVGFYIPDFVIPSRVLIVEIDGGYHMVEDQVKYDARKDAFMEEVGFQTVRIRNEDVKNWPMSRLKQYPLCKASKYKTLVDWAGVIKTKSIHTKPKTKRLKLTPKDKLRNTIKDILKLEKQLCVCLDTHDGDEDPCCQAHEWAREIQALIKHHHARLR